MTDRVWDAIVIGAGPAGSIAARELARRGSAVLLVDKATFPRSKVCGCCLNGAALAALDAIGLGQVPAKCGAVPLRTMHLASGRHAAELALPVGAAVSREAFDLSLLREAEAAGATILEGTVARVVPSSGDSFVRVDLPDGSRRARVAILATGLASAKPHAVQQGSRLGGGVIVPRAAAPEFFSRGVIYMATGRGGYVGLVRLEDDRLDIAAAFEPNLVRTAGGLGPAAEAILATTDWPAIPGLADLPWKGTATLTRRPAAVAAYRLFAVGDAAGYVEPFTGEGMAWAIGGAAALAPLAHRAALSWDNAFIAQWEAAHGRIVRRRQFVCRAAARVLRSPLLTGVAIRALTRLPALARPVVAMLNRPALHLGRLA